MCSCGQGGTATQSPSSFQVQAPGGAITTWRSEQEAAAAAARTGGKVL